MELGAPRLLLRGPGAPSGAEGPGRTVPRKEAPQKRKRGVQSPGDPSPAPHLAVPTPRPGGLGRLSRVPTGRLPLWSGVGRRTEPAPPRPAPLTVAQLLRSAPAPPQRCEWPPTALLLPEGSAYSGRCHHHNLSRRRRRRPVAEAAQPPRFRSSRSPARTPPPRPAPPPRDFPRRKRPRAHALLRGRLPPLNLLDARAHAQGRPAAGGTHTAPPSSRLNPFGARAGKLRRNPEGGSLLHRRVTSLPLPPNQGNWGVGGESPSSMKYPK